MHSVSITYFATVCFQIYTFPVLLYIPRFPSLVNEFVSMATNTADPHDLDNSQTQLSSKPQGNVTKQKEESSDLMLL